MNREAHLPYTLPRTVIGFPRETCKQGGGIAFAYLHSPRKQTQGANHSGQKSWIKTSFRKYSCVN